MTATWQAVRRACEDHGLEVRKRGSEYMVVGIAQDGKRRAVRIGHKWCSSPNTTVPRDYIAKLKRTFGLKNADFRR